MTLNWQPTATIGTLRERARLIATVRAFFAARGIWEVETPVLGQGGSTDVHLVSLSSLARTDKGQRKLWLQTSPEFHMKRLLAADSGPIFSWQKAFVMAKWGLGTISNSPCWSGTALVSRWRS